LGYCPLRWPGGAANCDVGLPGIHAALIGDKGLDNDWAHTEPGDRGDIAVIPPKADRKAAIPCDFADNIGASRRNLLSQSQPMAQDRNRAK
jgi:hypothetical protein